MFVGDALLIKREHVGEDGAGVQQGDAEVVGVAAGQPRKLRISCQARDQGLPEAGGRLPAGRRLVLATGLAEIVFASGAVTLPQMPRAGFVLNVALVPVIVGLVLLLGPWVFDVRLDVVPAWVR